MLGTSKSDSRVSFGYRKHVAIILRNSEVRVYETSPQFGKKAICDYTSGTAVPIWGCSAEMYIADLMFASILTSTFRKMIVTCFLDPKCT